MYNGTERVKFSLSFRVYAKQAIGNSAKMTGYRRAMTLLTAYASPVHTLETTNAVDYLATNVGTTVVQATLALTDLADFAIKGAEGRKKHPETKFTKEITKSYKLVSDAAANAWTAFKSDSGEFPNAMIELGKAGMAAVQHLENGASSSSMHSDLDRLSSNDNFLIGKYGGCIWSLNIMPGLCMNTFPVYIDSWSVKPSTEIDASGVPSYCDFDISCVMDQIKPSYWWQAMLVSDDYEAYKQLQKAYNDKVSSTV